MKQNKITNWLFKKIGAWLEKDSRHPLYPTRSYLCDFDRVAFEAKPADVLLMEGKHRISSIIRYITSSPWTHAVLYIGRLHDIQDEKIREIVKKHCGDCPPTKQLVVESVLGKGTIISPLDKYRDYHIRICRPVGLSQTDAQKVVAYAVDHLGTKYSVRHILDLARLIFPWGLWPRRWRSSLFEYNAGQPTEDICSSMIAEAFSSVNFPILPIMKKKANDSNKYEFIHRNPRLYTPNDFDYSPYFAIIKYPIFSLDEPAAYKKLPWKKGVISDDEGHLITLTENKKSDEQNKQV